MSDNYVTNDLDREDYNFLRYSKTITNLDPNTTYFARSYARNAVGTGYGNEEWFITCSEIPNNSIIGSWESATDPYCSIYLNSQVTTKLVFTSDSVFYFYPDNTFYYSSPFTLVPGNNDYYKLNLSNPDAPFPYYLIKFLDCNNIHFLNAFIDYGADPSDYFKRISP